MKHFLYFAAALLFCCSMTAVSWAGPQYTDPDQADDDFAIQGEYSGMVQSDEGGAKVGVQVIALGKGQFRAVVYVGGLPGDGFTGHEKMEVEGSLDDGVVTFRRDGYEARLLQRLGRIEVLDANNQRVGSLTKITRKSPTLDAAPPDGADVLFDGTSIDKWENGRMTPDGLLMQGTTSKPTYQSQRVHIEFRLPYMPEDRGQGRGNSGIYLQGRYEVQMLDSFGLEGKMNESGGIYTIKDPDLNMCYPPLSWQTYDIEFHAAKYDVDGNVTAQPWMTVRHNGVVVQNHVELPHSTTAAPKGPGPEPGPIYLQDHGCPVRYRNIWVLPLDE